MVNVAILGATGYGGVELVRLLQDHLHVRLAYLSSERYAGQNLRDINPHLAASDGVLRSLDPAAVAAECEVALLALPAGRSMEVVPTLLEGGVRVIDVSPDFRLRDPDVYKTWYGADHLCPDLLAEAALGIPEWYRDEIASCRLCAAPGCYSTGAILALTPLLVEELIDPSDIVVDGKTGVSGAGRTALKLAYHFPEANEDVTAYSVGGHRHLAEMVQAAQTLAECNATITFTPHLVPMTRGILLTIYVRPTSGVTVEELRQSLERYYAEEPFVEVLPSGEFPHTKWAAGTNMCFLAAGMDKPSGRGILVAAIDNLGKGMAGQMVQCLNLMLGVDETTGLTGRAAYP